MIPSLIVIVVPEEFVIPPALLPVNSNPSLIVTALSESEIEPVTINPSAIVTSEFGSDRSPRKVVAPVINAVPVITVLSVIVKEPVLLSNVPRMLMLSAFAESPSVTFW